MESLMLISYIKEKLLIIIFDLCVKMNPKQPCTLLLNVLNSTKLEINYFTLIDETFNILYILHKFVNQPKLCNQIATPFWLMWKCWV